MQFEDLNLIEPLLRAVRAEGYTTPTPIQQQAIPHVLEGRDLLGIAQTGTGKTAAFALPILQYLAQKPRQHNGIRVLVLAPTRELASQISDSFRVYGKNTHTKAIVIFGGVGQTPQVEALRRNPEVVVAAPGRLLDLMNQGIVRLDKLEVFVLDEADRMLDMGFIHDVRRIIAALPRQRQTLFFSATMPGEIQSLARDILREPVRVEVTPAATTVEKIEQSVYFVEKKQKLALLQRVLQDDGIRRVLVFTRTKHGANRLSQQLGRVGINAEAIHGNKSQTARETALANFKRGTTRVLVATDIAARGIDVEEITHVINFELPHEPETYVHRIGRTARAGADGSAYSFCDSEERPLLRDIERLTRMRIPVRETPTDLPSAAIEERPPRPEFGGGRSSNRNQPSQGNAPRSRSESSERREAPRPQAARPEPSRSGDAPRPQAARSEPTSRSESPRPMQQASRPAPASNNRPGMDRSSSDASASNRPPQPVRRKRPLPAEEDREAPVLTDRFGNPIRIASSPAPVQPAQPVSPDTSAPAPGDADTPSAEAPRANPNNRRRRRRSGQRTPNPA